jgi:hypothetical protein
MTARKVTKSIALVTFKTIPQGLKTLIRQLQTLNIRATNLEGSVLMRKREMHSKCYESRQGVLEPPYKTVSDYSLYNKFA